MTDNRLGSNEMQRTIVKFRAWLYLPLASLVASANATQSSSVCESLEGRHNMQQYSCKGKEQEQPRGLANSCHEWRCGGCGIQA